MRQEKFTQEQIYRSERTGSRSSQYGRSNQYDRSSQYNRRRKSNRKRKKRNNKRLIRAILLLLLILIAIHRCDAKLFDSAKLPNGSDQIDISGEVQKGEIPMFMQTDMRWGSKPYGNGLMAENGCGPTCLSMVYCGLTGDDKWNPYNLACKADEEGYYVAGSGTTWLAMSELADEIGLKCHEVRFDEKTIKEELQNGTPIICAMRPGDFTTTGHFIVLAGIDKKGNVIVRDPNSERNSEKTWPLTVLMPQIKNLWGYETESSWFIR